MSPKPAKDYKKDKRYQDGSFFKALHGPPVVPAIIDTPEKAIAAKSIRRQMIIEDKERRSKEKGKKRDR